MPWTKTARCAEALGALLVDGLVFIKRDEAKRLGKLQVWMKCATFTCRSFDQGVLTKRNLVGANAPHKVLCSSTLRVGPAGAGNSPVRRC